MTADVFFLSENVVYRVLRFSHGGFCLFFITYGSCLFRNRVRGSTDVLVRRSGQAITARRRVAGKLICGHDVRNDGGRTGSVRSVNVLNFNRPVARLAESPGRENRKKRKMTTPLYLGTTLSCASRHLYVYGGVLFETKSEYIVYSAYGYARLQNRQFICLTARTTKAYHAYTVTNMRHDVDALHFNSSEIDF